MIRWSDRLAKSGRMPRRRRLGRPSPTSAARSISGMPPRARTLGCGPNPPTADPAWLISCGSISARLHPVRAGKDEPGNRLRKAYHSLVSAKPNTGQECGLGSTDVLEPSAGDDLTSAVEAIKIDRNHRFDLHWTRMELGCNRRDCHADDEGYFGCAKDQLEIARQPQFAGAGSPGDGPAIHRRRMAALRLERSPPPVIALHSAST